MMLERKDFCSSVNRGIFILGILYGKFLGTSFIEVLFYIIMAGGD